MKEKGGEETKRDCHNCLFDAHLKMTKLRD